MRPLIGVAANVDLNRFDIPAVSVPVAYISSIVRAGGTPLILPFTGDETVINEMSGQVNGFLFPGGIDIDPSFYNEPQSEKLGRVDREMDLFQLSLIRRAIERKKPILAICRGLQLANVALGGTLHQDIPSEFIHSDIRHMQEVISYDTDHELFIEPGSLLFELFGSRMMINSRHHQSIKEPGDGLIITARAPDGVIEAAQHRELPMLLVQWHPELMMQKNCDMLPLFRMFVDRCTE